MPGLEAEWADQPRSRRLKLLIKAAQREALLFLALQPPLRRTKLPTTTKKILWVYHWPTIGDSIMDLSQRYLLPAHVQVDLCIPHAPAMLWAKDDLFQRVFSDVDQCPTDYDFVILQDISSYTIKLKLRKFFFTPFFSVLEHLQGERFARMVWARDRLAALVGCDSQFLYPPKLHLGTTTTDVDPTHFDIALVLGGQDQRRIYDKWPTVVSSIIQTWPAELPPPRFQLLGQGESALENLRGFGCRLDEGICISHVNALTLSETAEVIRLSRSFLGADGGLMHIAAALQKPGLALFSGIQPEWRLHPASDLIGIGVDMPLRTLRAEQIAHEFVFHLQCTEAFTHAGNI